jgi:broad specificity phosphatase PhoE
MELVCVRHGRTAWNAERRFQGQTDIPLDGEGQAQAAALGQHLRAERFDVAVTSDLARARATAEAICAGRPIVLEPEPRLREMHFGAWEGLTWSQIVIKWPQLATNYEYSPRHYVPEGGESWEALVARVDGVLRDVAGRLDDGGRALLVGHAGVLHAILHLARHPAGAGEDAALRVRLSPASIIRLRGSHDAGWEVTALNETAPSPSPAA